MLNKLRCMTPYDLYELYSLSTNDSLSLQNVTTMSMGILLSVQQKDCVTVTESSHHTHADRPTSSAVWGYSFLFVTIINLCSLVGAIVLPFMKMVVYKIILIFMVALAVGSLAGSGLLFLIPEALGLAEHDTSYIFQSATVIGGIYLFYFTERIMKMLMQWREDKKRSKEDDSENKGNIFCSVRRRTPRRSESEMKDPSHLPSDGLSCTQVTLLDDTEVEPTNVDNGKMANGTSSSSISSHIKTNGVHERKDIGNKHPIATVAYMIIFGDGLHNFIDGLSIGAAFTDSILAGVSVSVACICEELPHELGDFAILLNSGMSLKNALLYNFLSACMCYLGLIVGVVLGENTSSHEYVFAVAGGMFLYISLVDMMPEMNSTAESAEAKRFGTIKVFLLQNVGMMCGFGIMLVLAIYGGEISFE